MGKGDLGGWGKKEWCPATVVIEFSVIHHFSLSLQLLLIDVMTSMWKKPVLKSKHLPISYKLTIKPS